MTPFTSVRIPPKASKINSDNTPTVFCIAIRWNRRVCLFFLTSVRNTLIISVPVISAYLSCAVYFQMTQTCTNTAGLIKTQHQYEWIVAQSAYREKRKRREDDGQFCLPQKHQREIIRVTAIGFMFCVFF